jgi:hypothetical protein
MAYQSTKSQHRHPWVKFIKGFKKLIYAENSGLKIYKYAAQSLSLDHFVAIFSIFYSFPC